MSNTYTGALTFYNQFLQELTFFEGCCTVRERRGGESPVEGVFTERAAGDDLEPLVNAVEVELVGAGELSQLLLFLVVGQADAALLDGG